MTAGAAPPPTGRFAPSPTGPLHAGSLVAALASWLDARARAGHWLVRIEDVDAPRCVPGMDQMILQQLDALGLRPDAAPVRQSQRQAAYGQALDRLLALGRAYPCACSRRDVETALAETGRPRVRHTQAVYPGTCRNGLHGKAPRATRFLTERADASSTVDWTDRRLGAMMQAVAREVGDFVLHRADGLWTYQLAVVVDDAWQGITDVVRGEDLADNTARQILLQRALGLPTPRYLHTPLVRGADGHKLSKQNGAQALDLADPLAALQAAARVLDLPHRDADGCAEWLHAAIPAWAARWMA